MIELAPWGAFNRLWLIQPSARQLSAEANMQRVDGYYLYQIGSQIHPLGEFKGDSPGETRPTTYGEAILPLYVAESALEPLITRSVFHLKTSVSHGNALLSAIRYIKDRINADNDYTKILGLYDVYQLKQALTNFEALGAGLGISDLYLVIKHGGFDTPDLISAGHAVFPIELPNKVPEAIGDVQQATRCIAFELPTAAGFHLHRANESVLHRYYDAVTGGKARPSGRNIGDYLNELNKHKKGDAKVKASLKDLKDLHRNPLIHPEHSLETVDEAIDLLGSVRAVVGHMLRELPTLPPPAPPISTPTVPGGSSP
jgi:hypothetical protein